MDPGDRGYTDRCHDLDARPPWNRGVQTAKAWKAMAPMECKTGLARAMPGGTGSTLSTGLGKNLAQVRVLVWE